MAVAGALRRRLARRAAGRRPHAVAARRRRWPARSAIFALTALRAASRTASSGLRGTVHGRPATAASIVRADRARTRTGSRPPPGRAAGWWSTGWSEVAPGVYRTTEPIPVDGEWKTMIRLHRGRDAERAAGLPARRPGDPGRGHPRRARSSTRDVRRPSSSCSSASARPASPGWLWAVGVRRRAGDRARRSSPLLAWGVHRVSLAPGRTFTLPAGRRARARRPAARPRPRATITANPRRRSDCGSALGDHRAQQRARRRSRAPASR